MRLACRTWLPALLLTALLARPGQAQERHALLIGANAGWAQDTPLRYAEADAERLRAVLVELGGFPSENVVLLRDPDTATVRAQLEGLGETLRARGRPSVFVLYYSGHADAERLHLRGPALTHDALYAQLEALPATVKLAVLDACRSGSILAAKGGRPTAAFQLRVVDALAVQGLAVLTSSGADELSQETRALAGSVFTHHLVSGLRGAADADADGAVTLSEVYRYAHQRTEVDTAASTAPHRPAFRLQVQGQGELVLTRLAEARARLLLPAGEPLRYVVVDAPELRLVAEGHSQEAREVELALAPGDYRLKRLGGREGLEVAALALAPDARVEASTLRYEPRPLEAGLLKGDPARMDEAERHQWKRTEALRLLAEGEAAPALGLLEELLARQPGDLGALRGRARALLRLAEARGEAGDVGEERALRHEALLADASLVEDAGFVRRYRQLGERQSAEQRASQVRAHVQQELRTNPRLTRRWSLGVELLGPRGLLAVVGSVLLGEAWQLHVATDPLGLALVGLPSLDVGGRRLFAASERLGTFLGLGLHLSRAGWPGSWESDPLFDLRLLYRTAWGNGLHADAGVQYLFDSGLAVELSASLVLSYRSANLSLQPVPMLGLGASWYF